MDRRASTGAMGPARSAPCSLPRAAGRQARSRVRWLLRAKCEVRVLDIFQRLPDLAVSNVVHGL